MPVPLVLALLLHLGAAWWLHQQLLAPPELELRVKVEASLEQLAEPLLEEEPRLVEELQQHELNLEPVATSLDDVEQPTDVVDVLGLGGSGGGNRGRLGPESVLGGTSPGEGLLPSSPFGGWLEQLRERGVEVAFVIDATGSMQAFIDRARDTIDSIASDLSTVVPGVRLAAVAYRDTGDPWVTRHVDFADHPWQLSNFLLELEASGGMRQTPDFEEAVELGLAVAVDQLSWSEHARRVILVVGDAPWHDEDQQAVLALARRFSRGDQALIDTLYIGAPDGERPTEAARRARDAFERLARAGDGQPFELVLPRDDQRGPSEIGRYRIGTGDEQAPEDPAVLALRRQVVEAAFGAEWRADVERWIASGHKDPRSATVARRVARGDRVWVREQLLSRTLHPALVDACRQFFDGAMAATCLTVLLDEARPLSLRWAVLAVLRQELRDAREVPFDPSLPRAEQERSIIVLRRRVLEIPGAAAVLEPTPVPRLPSTPPPPPGAAGG